MTINNIVSAVVRVLARYGRAVAMSAVRDQRSPPAVRRRLQRSDGTVVVVLPERRRRRTLRPGRTQARRAGALFVPLRRARSAHRRREEPARDEDRRRGDRLLFAGGTGRHREDGQVQGGQAQRLQRGRRPQEAGRL